MVSAVGLVVWEGKGGGWAPWSACQCPTRAFPAFVRSTAWSFASVMLGKPASVREKVETRQEHSRLMYMSSGIGAGYSGLVSQARAVGVGGYHAR